MHTLYVVCTAVMCIPLFNYFRTTVDSKRITRSTGCLKVTEAQKAIRKFIDNLHYEGLTLGQYANKFTKYSSSPRVLRILSEGNYYFEIASYINCKFFAKIITQSKSQAACSASVMVRAGGLMDSWS